MDSSGLVIDLKKTDGDIYRYHLDPNQGMMPVKVEFFDIRKDGSLALRRVFTVEKYRETQNGAFYPAASTLHDFVSVERDGTVKSRVEQQYEMMDLQENVQFSDDEFILSFPPGTVVTDFILDHTYTIGEEEQRLPDKAHAGKSHRGVEGDASGEIHGMR